MGQGFEHRSPLTGIGYVGAGQSVVAAGQLVVKAVVLQTWHQPQLAQVVFKYGDASAFIGDAWRQSSKNATW